MSIYETKEIPDVLLTMKDPIVIDVKVTRDTIYDEDTYLVTMVVATHTSILDFLLEPIKGSNQVLRLYDLIGAVPKSINMIDDCGKKENHLIFDIEARGGRANAILMLCPLKIPFRHFIISGRAEVEQLSFVNTIDSNNLSFKIKDRATGEIKWFNFNIEGTLDQKFKFIDKVYALRERESTGILATGDILYFGDLALHLSCDIKGE